jgi:hypothetical protein
MSDVSKRKEKGMKVKELIERLKEFDPTSEVYVSIDSEGNGFSKVADADPSYFNTKYVEAIHPDDYPEYATDPAVKAVIIIWP